MAIHIRRRKFIVALGGAAAWPLAARAQQAAMPVIGFLSPGSPEPFSYLVAAFREGLMQAGYIEGQNIVIEYRWAKGQYGQLPALAADLVRLQVVVIAASGGSITAHAAKAASAAIPIVFNVGDDPIKSGLVASLNRPGGNIAGVSVTSAALEPKRLGLLREVVLQATTVGVLLNPTNPDSDFQRHDVEISAAAIGQQLHILNASSENEIDAAFAALVQQRADGLLVGNDAFFNSRREQIVELAVRHGLPAIYSFRSFAESGGLMSYGANLLDVYRQVGLYVGRILKGEKPADLPVVQPIKFEFVINLKTVKTMGIKLSDNLLSVADEVIE